jgi:hypothetical protein
VSTEDTAASEHRADADTTQVPPPPGDEPELAWSVDDDTDEMSTNRHGLLMWAGLAVLVVAITAALVLLATTLFAHQKANTAKQQPVPSATPPSTYVPPPATYVPPAPVAASPPVTVTPPTPTPIYSAKDQEFIGLLRHNDRLGDPGTNTPAVLATAQYVCDEMQSGGNPTELHSRLHAVWPSIAENDVTWFLYNSTAVYCPSVGAGAY